MRVAAARTLKRLDYSAAAGLCTSNRFFSANSKSSGIPVDTKKTHETVIVEKCGSKWMQWLGKGSAMQIYCALLFSGNMIFQADPGANLYELLATSGAISSASFCVFFGAKLLCDKIVTDIISYRTVGDKDEYVRISVLGAISKHHLHVSPSDLRLLEHDGKEVYKFAIGERQLTLDTSTGFCRNRKGLEILLQGQPLVTRRGKQGKKKTKMRA